jgi:hypothetical protein
MENLALVFVAGLIVGFTGGIFYGIYRTGIEIKRRINKKDRK